jgi:hypothetical protein
MEGSLFFFFQKLKEVREQTSLGSADLGKEMAISIFDFPA